jgi:single-strand DNA-binding protein
MANYNKVILVGNLTRDPQLSYLPSQMAVVEFGLAVNRRWRSQDNQTREETCFVDCRAYGRQAETINQHLAKGRPVLVEGRLQYDTWEGKDGVKRSKHRVVVERFQFLGAAGPARSQAGAQAPSEPAGPEVDHGDANEAPPADDSAADDIPF